MNHNSWALHYMRLKVHHREFYIIYFVFVYKVVEVVPICKLDFVSF